MGYAPADDYATLRDGGTILGDGSKFSYSVEFKVIFIFILLIFNSLIIISAAVPLPEEPEQNSGPVSRNAAALGFTNISTNLPMLGDYNYIAMGDFNNDAEIDIAFGGEDWDIQDTVGLYAYTGNGGTNWTSNGTGLWPSNSWGGLQLADADEDGYMELYATDEDWGTRNSSGVKAWEFRSGVWKDSSAHVTTPVTSGQPSNVILTNMTGDSRLDMLVCTYTGVKYFENKGGNPVTWQARSGGLPTSSWYTGAAVSDMNADGLKDIITVRNDQERMFVQQASGTLWKEYSSGLSVPGYVLGIVAADLNQDSHNDIIFATCTPSDGNGLRVWLGNSGGVSGTSFSWTAANTGLPTTRRYAQIQAVDIDMDGDLDIIGPCASGDEGMKIFLGNGSDKPGTYLGWTEATNTNLPAEGDWYGANTYDINGDGSLDIVGASWGMGVRAWLNNFSKDGTPPAAVSDLTAVETTTDSIKVNWTAPADNGTDVSSGPAASYDIRYSTSTINLGNWNNAVKCTGEPIPASPGTFQEFNITGLAPASQYFIVIRTEDEMPNISPLSNLLINSTAGIIDIIPPGMILDLAIETVTNDTINLTWTAPADNGTDASSGPVIEYDLRHYSAVIKAGNWNLATTITPPPTPGLPDTPEFLSINGLESETTYYYAVKARDERPNWGVLSNSPFGVTLPDPDITAPAAVTDLTASEPTVASINLTWTAPGDDGSTGTALSYDLRYSKSIIDDVSWSTAVKCTDLSVPQAAGTEELYQVTDLEPETTYYFAIKSADETPLWSALSNIATNTTLPVPDEVSPAEIIDLNTGNPTYTTITLTWTAPGDDGVIDPAVLYDIRYGSEPVTAGTWPLAEKVLEPPEPGAPGEPESYVVTGLDLNTAYYFAIKTADEVPNWSPVSNSPSATTLDLEGDLFELILAITPELTEINSGESIKLALEAVSWPEQLLVPDAQVTFSSETAGALFSPASGTTDPRGMITVTLTAPAVTERTELSVQSEVEKEGFIPNSTFVVLTVKPPEDEKKFNLHITDNDITFTKLEGGEGANMTISANITNDGLLDATGFLVLFYVDGAQLGSADNLTGLESLDVLSLTRTWTVSGGAHTVRVEVIPWHPNLESDAGDNSAEVIVTIQGSEVIDIKPNTDPPGGDGDDNPGDGNSGEPTEGTGGSDARSFWSNLITALFAVIIIVLIGAVLLVIKTVRNPEHLDYNIDDEQFEEE